MRNFYHFSEVHGKRPQGLLWQVSPPILKIMRPSWLRAYLIALPGIALLALGLLAINVFQTLSLILLIFSPTHFRRFNRGCANTWWGSCALWQTHILGVDFEVLGDSLPLNENALLTINHQCMTDIPALFPLAMSVGRLGDMKWFVKDPVKFVPGVGWGMLFLDCIFLKRNWNQDQARVEATFNRLKTNRTPFWLVSFSEGTRRTPKKLAVSQRYARQVGLQIPKNVMLPRPKGFIASVQGLRGDLDAVYDLTLQYPDGVPSMTDLIMGRVRRIRLWVRRYPIASLPQDEKGLGDWLLQRFAEKDAWIESKLEKTGVTVN